MRTALTCRPLLQLGGLRPAAEYYGPIRLPDHQTALLVVAPSFLLGPRSYSPVQLGEFAKAEKYCRAAIHINPNRANGFKNLALALQGQGRHREAARSFVDATQANAADARSLGHLDALLKDHPELQLEFAPELECCRKAVALVAEKLAQAEAAWQPRQKGDQP